MYVTTDNGSSVFPVDFSFLPSSFGADPTRIFPFRSHSGSQTSCCARRNPRSWTDSISYPFQFITRRVWILEYPVLLTKSSNINIMHNFPGLRQNPSVQWLSQSSEVRVQILQILYSKNICNIMKHWSPCYWNVNTPACGSAGLSLLTKTMKLAPRSWQVWKPLPQNCKLTTSGQTVKQTP